MTGSSASIGTAGNGQTTNGGGENEECVFCLDAVTQKDAVFSTNCPSHVSHEYCLMRWLETSRSCATCRTEVVAVKRKSGKNVALPALRPLEPDDPRQPDIPHLDDEEFINADLTSEEDEDDDDDFDTEAVVVVSGRPIRRSTRQSGVPLRMSAAERAREDMIARMTGMVAAGVGATRRGRGGLRVSSTSRRQVTSAAARRRAPAAPIVDLDELDERLEGVLRAERQGGSRRIIAYSDSEEDEEEPVRPARRNRSAQNANEELDEVQAPTRGGRRVIESSEEGEQTESEGSETDSGESGTEEEGSGEEASDGSELDESVLRDDQPSTSHSMAPIVRRRRTAKKKTTKRKKTTTRKKKTTEGGVVRRKSTKRKRKGTKRGSKRSKDDKDSSQPRNRISDYFRPLSLNGAGLEPVSDGEDAQPVAKRPRVDAPPPPPPPANDPTDLLGSILTSQVVAHAPGRYLQQRDGRLVPRDNFNRHLDRMEKRGALPVNRSEVAPLASSSTTTTSSMTSSVPPSAPRSTTTRTGQSSSVASTVPNKSISRTDRSGMTSSRVASHSHSLPRLVPLVSKFDRSTPLPPPPPPLPSSNQSVDSDEGPREKKEPSPETKQRMVRDRCLQIRNAAETILNDERREGRISNDDHKQLVVGLLKKFSGRPTFERKEVLVWSRIMLGRLLEEKMRA